MWRAIGLATALAASGCAARHVPDRIISTDWAAVTSLPPRTDLSVFLDDDTVNHGRLEHVDATALTIWERNGAATIPRPRVARVATRTPKAASRAHSFLKATLGSAAIAGLAGAVVAVMGENGSTKDDGVAVFIVGTMAGAAWGAAGPPGQTYEERLVYIRP
jgi:hypothetical protein